MRGSRVVLLVVLLSLGGATVSWGADTASRRAYLALRLGGAYFTGDRSAPGAELQNPASETIGAAAVGLNLDKHWSVEVAGEGFESGLDVPDGRKAAELAIWSIRGQLRLRHATLQDRLTPYLVLGGGVGFTEVNDRDITSPINLGRDRSVIGSIGGGLEYFVANNIAVGLELVHLYAFGTEVNVEGTDRDLSLDSLLFSLGLRLFFPEVRGAAPGELAPAATPP